jgi:hypothetical protein
MDKEKAEELFAILYFGKHHIPGELKKFGDGWSINHFQDCATFDYDFITRLVFLCHDRCVRASIMQGGPRAVKIVLWQRNGREGSMSERHPTIETALLTWRKNHPESEII